MMTNGKLSIRDFHFLGRTADDALCFIQNFSMNIDSLYPSDKKYFLSSLLLDSAFLKYEQYDYLDNFSRMLGIHGDKVLEAYAEHRQVNIIFVIADYISELARNLINSPIPNRSIDHNKQPPVIQ